MYYEEKIIDGLLYWRGSPLEGFKPMSIDMVTDRLLKLRRAVDWTLEDMAYKPPEMALGAVAEKWHGTLRGAR